eukprot:COSAG06_NODE_3084_length_5880_cov_3.762325_3_plen_85_part_00
MENDAAMTTAARPNQVKNGLLKPFIYIMIILPRQARDKHRENSKKEAVLSQGALDVHGTSWVPIEYLNYDCRPPSIHARSCIDR